MAASEVSICSNASLLLGGQRIASFDENTDRAKLAADLWEPVRNYVLRRHPWNCATKRVALAPDVATPAFDWAFQYTLPGDYLRTLSVGERGVEAEFKIESDGAGRSVLLCDDNPVYLRYIWRNTTPASWDDMLIWAMTVSMKAVMAYPVTQSTSLEQLVEAGLKDVLKQARAVDGQDDTPETFGDSPLLSARYGGR